MKLKLQNLKDGIKIKDTKINVCHYCSSHGEFQDDSVYDMIEYNKKFKIGGNYILNTSKNAKGKKRLEYNGKEVTILNFIFFDSKYPYFLEELFCMYLDTNKVVKVSVEDIGDYLGMNKNLEINLINPTEINYGNSI